MASMPDDPPDYRYHRIIFTKTMDTPEGKTQKRKTIYLKKSAHYGKAGFTKTEAAEWMKRRELAFKDGTWSPWGASEAIQKHQAVSLDKAIKEYLSETAPQLASSTHTHHKYYLERLARDIGGRQAIGTIRRQAFQGWINEPQLSWRTKKYRRSLLRSLLEYAERKGWVEQAPELVARARKAEKKAGDKTFIRPSEFGRAKRAARQIHQRRMDDPTCRSPAHRKYRGFEAEFDYIFDFLINTALRRADFLNLSTSWFVREGKMLRIGDSSYRPKSQQPSETIPLTRRARQVGQRWRKAYGADTRPFADINPKWMSRFFREVFEIALPEKADRLSLHKMRDSAAMYLLFEKGYSPQTVQQITRHKDLSTLMVYTHNAPDLALREIEDRE